MDWILVLLNLISIDWISLLLHDERYNMFAWNFMTIKMKMNWLCFFVFLGEMDPISFVVELNWFDI